MAMGLWVIGWGWIVPGFVEGLLSCGGWLVGAVVVIVERASAVAGGMSLALERWGRSVLYQDTQSAVARSTSSRLFRFEGVVRWSVGV